jgi:hypothetical protein
MELCIKNILTSCQITKNKRFVFNMNQYRNAHYQTLNKAKRSMNTWIKLLNIKKKFRKPVSFKYYITCKSNSDFANYGYVVDKFLQDALVKNGVLIDDSVSYVIDVRFKFVKKGKLKVDVSISD